MYTIEGIVIRVSLRPQQRNRYHETTKTDIQENKKYPAINKSNNFRTPLVLSNRFQKHIYTLHARTYWEQINYGLEGIRVSPSPLLI